MRLNQLNDEEELGSCRLEVETTGPEELFLGAKATANWSEKGN
jgi:hypothetical protein